MGLALDFVGVEGLKSKLPARERNWLTACKQGLLCLFLLLQQHLPLFAAEGILLLPDAVVQLLLVRVGRLRPSQASLVLVLVAALV